jgi:hypothetical protein
MAKQPVDMRLRPDQSESSERMVFSDKGQRPYSV